MKKKKVFDCKFVQWFILDLDVNSDRMQSYKIKSIKPV
jgi:hypothetical protein